MPDNINPEDTVSIKGKVLRLRKERVDVQLPDGNVLTIHRDHIAIESKAVLESPENKAILQAPENKRRK